MAPDMTLKERLDHLVGEIIREVHPVRIVLFGSAARGEMGTGSDLDLLIVMPRGSHRRRTAQHLYCRLSGIGIPFDLVVTTADDLERHRNNPGLIYALALREGRELYAA